MLTKEQQADLAYKLIQGRANTHPDRAIFEEAIKSAIPVVPETIWFEASSIPATAPVITPTLQLDPETNTNLTYGDSGVVRYYVDLQLQAVPGSDRSFSHPCLKNCIPFNFDENGSYLHTIKTYTNTTLAFGVSDWVIDPSAGVLTFYDENLSALGIIPDTPPKISFYRYIGHKGITPMPDSASLLKKSTDATAQAQILVDGPTGTISVYHLPVLPNGDPSTFVVESTEKMKGIIVNGTLIQGSPTLIGSNKLVVTATTDTITVSGTNLLDYDTSLSSAALGTVLRTVNTSGTLGVSSIVDDGSSVNVELPFTVGASRANDSGATRGTVFYGNVVIAGTGLPESRELHSLIFADKTTGSVALATANDVGGARNVQLPAQSGTLIIKDTTTSNGRIAKFTSDGIIANSNISDLGTEVDIYVNTEVTGYLQADSIKVGSGLTEQATITIPSSVGNISLTLPSVSGTFMLKADHLPASQLDYDPANTSLIATTGQAAIDELAQNKMQYAGTIDSGSSYPSPAVIGGLYLVTDTLTLGGQPYNKADLAFHSTAGSWVRIPLGFVDAKNVEFDPTGVTYGDGSTAVTKTDAQSALADLFEHKADLDGSGRLPASQLPLSVVGALQYQGTWNVSVPGQTYPDDTVVGHYYIVTGGPATIEGILFTSGDWIIREATGWQVVQGGNAVDVITVGADQYQGKVTFASTVPITLGSSPSTGTITFGASPATKLAVGVVRIGDALTVDGNGLLSLDVTDGLAIDGTSKKLRADLNTNGLEIDVNHKLGIKAGSEFTYSAGSLVLANTGVVAGSYPKVTVNAKGQVTAGLALLVSDVPVYVSGEAGATEFYNATNGKVAGLKITGQVAISKTGDAITLDFTQTNATTFASEFEITTPIDFDWSTRSTNGLTITSVIGAINANRQDLNEYVNLLRTQGNAVGGNKGANLIGVDGIVSVTPTGGASGGNGTLQAVLEGLKTYTDTVAISSGTANRLAKFNSSKLVNSSILDTGSAVTVDVPTTISGDLTLAKVTDVSSKLNMQVGGTAYQASIVATAVNTNTAFSLPSKSSVATATLLADFSVIDCGDFG